MTAPNASSRPLRIATRGSALALWQAHHIARRIRESQPEVVVEIVEVSTVGDRVQGQTLRSFGGVGVFTREVQQALFDDRGDVAVHSLKDLPTDIAPGLMLAATPERGATADALVLPTGVDAFDDPLPLKPNSRVATGSPRRQAQLRALRPDLELLEVRGNVDTRLKKLDAGEFDALILACAGLERLNFAARITNRLTPPVMYHAVGQGAIGLECRAEDLLTQQRLAKIHDPLTWAATTAERALLAALRAGCHAPVGVATTVRDRELTLTGVVLSADGAQRWVAEETAPLDQASDLGNRVAATLQAAGATAVL